MITGIQYGGQCIATASYKFKNEIDKKRISGSLSITMKNETIEIEGKVSAEYEDTDTLKSEEFQCSWIADVQTAEPNPTDVADAIAQARKFPEILKEVNDGKGVPLIFHLTPIDQICKTFEQQIAETLVLNTIGDSVMVDIKDVSIISIILSR